MLLRNIIGVIVSQHSLARLVVDSDPVLLDQFAKKAEVKHEVPGPGAEHGVGCDAQSSRTVAVDGH